VDVQLDRARPFEASGLARQCRRANGQQYDGAKSFA
jgi:hypothetical protein